MIRQEQIETFADIASETLKDLRAEGQSIPQPAVVEKPHDTAQKFEQEVTSLESKITDELKQTDGLLMFKTLLDKAGPQELKQELYERHSKMKEPKLFELQQHVQIFK